MYSHRIFNTTRYVLSLLIVVTAVSCSYTDLAELPPTYKVPVVADYSHLRYNYDNTNLRLYFFPLGGQMDMPGQWDLRDSSVATLPLGTYSLSAVNSESPHKTLSFDGYSDKTIRISLNKANTEGLPDSLQETFYDYPDRTCTFLSPLITIEKDDRRPGYAIPITVTPGEITRNITIRLTGIKHGEYIKRARFAVTGMPVEYYVADTARSGRTGALISEGKTEQADTFTVSSSFYTFKPSEGKHRAYVFLEGRNFKDVFTFDITGQVDRQKDSDNIHIELYCDYDLMDSMKSDMNVDVNDWKSQTTIDIIMP